MSKILIASASLAFLSLVPSCSSESDGDAPATPVANAMGSPSPAVAVPAQPPLSGQGAMGTEQTVAPALPASANPPAAMPTPPAATEALQPALPVVANADHAQLLSSALPELAANKRLVYDLWRTLIEAHDTQAAAQYLAEGYIQHNPNADTGRAGVFAYFGSLGAPLAVQERVQTPLVAIVAERDYVALVQVDQHDQPRPYTTTWFDLFRIQDGLVAEHWDHGRLPAEGSPRAYVPPAETTDQEAALVSGDPQLAGNKRLVYDMWRTLLDAQQVDEAPKFLAEGYVQHNPLANTGLQGFLTFFRQFAQPRAVQPTVANFIQEIAEGDLVVLATLRAYPGAAGSSYTTTWFDMFRVAGGLLVEHWDTGTLAE
jgi:predicted SnoaL-like aldol condensation-catalyzing enzyme